MPGVTADGIDADHVSSLRRLADRSEREAAEGGDLPMIGTDGPRPSRGTKEPADGVA